MPLRFPMGGEVMTASECQRGKEGGARMLKSPSGANRRGFLAGGRVTVPKRRLRLC